MVINNVQLNASLLDIITELKNQLEINGILMFSKIKPTNNDIMVSCPYHKGGQERRPSAGIRISDGRFHCFTCGEIHSLPEVISHCFGWDDTGIGGWKWLLKNYATTTAGERKGIQLDMSRNNPTIITYVSEQELDRYRYIHPYMYKRKLTLDIIELFDIGYDKESKCITFPQRDINGNTLFIARRSVEGKFFNYPSEVQKPLYGLYELSLQQEFPQEVIICESMLDALVCWVWGKYAVALNGLGTSYQMDVLNRLPVRKYILATDNDYYGFKARRKIASQIRNKLVTEYILPRNRKDLNELTEDEFLSLQEDFI